MSKLTWKNPFRKTHYSKQWIGFYWVFLANMLVFTLIAFLVEPIWIDINQFLGNAMSLHWNWLVIIMVVSGILICYGSFLSVANTKKIRKMEDDSIFSLHLANKIIPLTFFLGWNFMLYVLIKEGGEELRVIRPELENISPILFCIIIVILSILFPPTLKRIRKLNYSPPTLNRLKSGGILIFLVITNISGLLLPILAPPVNVLRGSLPEKPKIMAHRGASHLAPENTLVAGQVASDWGAIGWEVDVSISYDGILFLCHDDTAERTTNIAEIFPERVHDDVTMFNMSELHQLDAGSWFVEKDPYKTIHEGYVSQTEAEAFRGEKIPTLAEVLNLTRELDLYVDIDAEGPAEDHPFHDQYWDILLQELADSNLNDKIMINSNNLLATNMTKVGDGRDMINTHHALSNQVFREYEEQHVTVMVWTVDSPSRFSQLWCLGVDFVKTNALHILVPLEKPTWIISYKSYILIWGISCSIGMLGGILMFVMKQKKPEILPVE
ncbi:glycerophosphodiester phosphodiesterase family protein [Candidatus Lokiarchaeum ossiferum]|uniref:glycerophosphodiester phosphodiesterase family protein n=1 Tax=Candidatus Lokiarchaeum ossiferum TaxID=2951803 RepID=UPI00352DD216